MDIFAMMEEYIKPELLIITPVLYIIARIMNNGSIKSVFIPWALLLISMLLAGLYTFANSRTDTMPQILMALFITIVQGVLLSGTAVFGGILGQSITKKK